MPRSEAASAGAIEPTGEIDLRAIGAALKRRRGAWLLPTAFALAVVAVFVNVVPPRFTARTQILLENQETFFTRPDRAALGSEMSGQLDEAAVASQVQLIGSADIARRAIDALHLAGNPEFDPSAGGTNPFTRVLTLLGVLGDPTRETAEARMLQTFGQKLTVFSPAKTRVITIEFTSRDPQLAARAANEVAALYLSEQSSAKRSMARAAAEALAAQVGDLRAKLGEADAARERYRLSSGLLAGTNNMTISGQSLADINTDLSRARAQQADAQAKAATIRDLVRDGRAADVADITNSPIVRQLWNQRSVAQAQLATEARTLLPEHPRVKELAAQVKEYDAGLKSAARQAATTLENDAKVAGQRVANLEAALAQQKTLAGAANGDEVHLAALDRVSQGLKEQLQSSTAKYEEALARQGSNATPSDARVISRALPPDEPSFPKKVPFVIFAGATTLVFAVGYVVAGEIISGRADLDVASRVRDAALPVPLKSLPDAADGIATGEGGGGWIGERSGQFSATTSDLRGSRDGTAAVAMPAPATPQRSLPGFRRRRSDDEVVLAPVPAPGAGRASAEGTATLRRQALEWMAPILAYAAGFGRSAAASGSLTARAARRAAPRPPAPPENGGRHEGATPPTARSATPMVGWDRDARTASSVEDSQSPLAVPGDERSIGDVAQRIVDGHVPGRGLHVVGTGVGTSDVAARQIIALARALADKGRTIIVDLNATPARLAAMSGDAHGLSAVTALDGLSELLAGEASFAEVIHRDHATRLHFIPTGRQEADFRDFDLILDALTETYDFIVLLTPTHPQTEIAKVMAPYADFVVLSVGSRAEQAAFESFEDDLTAAGASIVLTLSATVRPLAQAVA